MSGLDLFERETEERFARMTPLERPEAGTWDGFARGTFSTMMQGFAKTARAVDVLGSVGPIAQDAITGGTEAQDRYFREHEEVFQSAVDYWEPSGHDIGAAGRIVGTMAGLLPIVVTSPSLAVATTQLSMAEDLVDKGVDATKAQGAAAAYAAGLGLGILVPVLGQNLWQRVLLGGAGFNVAQGVAMRGGAQVILKGTPAEGDFKALNPQDLTLDALLGMAFGGLAHVSPAMRAQGDEFWSKVDSWRARLSPDDVSALAVTRLAQHATADSLPGKPATPEDVAAHAERVKQAVTDLLEGRSVEVADMNAAKVAPDSARWEDARKGVETLTQEAERVRVEEGLPKVPESVEIARAPEIMEQKVEGETTPAEAADPIARAADRALADDPELIVRIGEDETGKPKTMKVS